MLDYISDINFYPCCKFITSMKYTFVENKLSFNPKYLSAYADYVFNGFETFYSFYYKNECYSIVLASFHCLETSNLLNQLFQLYSYDLIKSCCTFLHSRYVKKSRVYERIGYMLNNFKVCYFCTFTFDDPSLKLTTKYCRKVLTQMLKSLNTCYLGNVDFGDLHGRIHYHVIIAENDIHINKDSVKWSFGFYDIKVISNKDPTRLGSYIMKLVNHATKASTKDSIITPRGDFSFNNLMKNIS